MPTVLRIKGFRLFVVVMNMIRGMFMSKRVRPVPGFSSKRWK